MERMMRIELTPSAWKAEVLPLNYIRTVGAEDEIRTRDPRLGKAMLYPWATSAQLLSFKLVEGDGFEPSKAQLTDLQSAPFGHSGIPRRMLVFSAIKPIRLQAMLWSWWRESNPQPADYKSAALPLSHASIYTFKLAIRNGLEPSTSSVTGWHSNQLNYRTASSPILYLICFTLFA